MFVCLAFLVDSFSFSVVEDCVCKKVCECRLYFFYVLQDKRKDAVKKVIAAMTVGKDVSSLFTDVVNCMQTENLELKKLVYLYLINYAKSQPDLAILAVNTFVKVKARIAIFRLFVFLTFTVYVSVLFLFLAITNLLLSRLLGLYSMSFFLPILCSKVFLV